MRFSLIILFLLAVNIIKGQTAEKIVSKAEEILKGKTAHGIMEMIIKTPDFERTLKMESWWVGNEKALIVIKSPKREAGNKTLKIKNEIWNYLKNTETTIKIPPSMMLQSWNGSDFTNDDLVRESNLSKDYNKNLIGEEPIGGKKCWKIELVPKPNAPVVWGKLYYWIRQKDYMPSIVQYFDEKGNLIRYIVYSDVKKFGSRTMPSVWTMYSKTKEGHSTTVKILEMELDINIPDKIFSFQELERGN
ncbi:outer membrane lipoprotein-sorting protein [Melioribacteraceae bacterium 4301-Me]|uniref:outer membrane lipoprotein-sorting protein n=1 Tax=Pyranulibacter aquaticus TaxID=3163344 RepID=UPI003598C3EE